MKAPSRVTILAGSILLALAGYQLYRGKSSDSGVGKSDEENSGNVRTASAGQSAGDFATQNKEPGGASPDDSKHAGKNTPSDLTKTKVSTRSSSSFAAGRNAGGRKVTIDPMASWKDVPAWPEGPRLFAEVETSGKRYVNLRPNDMGLLPALNVEANEPMKITLSLPESDPGASIYLEIPNGGAFTDTSDPGKVLKVAANRTVSFDFIADETRGNCTVHIRQAGHTRTLPLWIGEPEALAQGEDQ